ncbi:MAG: sorbosone dehydrogenase family protein [Betaproteobacteria bacterium]|nr:sorbosone dehydrogenase family protein [Betaproteobacteria bacterium]
MTPLARLALAFALAAAPAVAAPPIERVKLPAGFEITLFAENVKDARSLALGEKGWLFVSTRSAGNVYAIRHDGKKALETVTIASGLNMPNGVAMKDGNLYVAEVNRIWRYDAIESQLPRAPKPVLVTDKYPGDRHHGWKFIRFGPDGWLYVPVGAPCNVCDREEPYASITRIKPDGSAMEVFARGVRNTVGFDWHPVTKELWFTDNGRDMMGDDIPPDELNHAPRAGMHFGFPHCHAGEIADPDFAKGKKCAEFTPPAQKFGAHVAGLGMRFYTGAMFPAEYANQAFIAEHGSWNRSKKSGYRVMRAKVEGGKVVEHAVFAEGFLDAAADKAWGRPVDVQVMPDGALLVSDDHANAIYRIALKGR